MPQVDVASWEYHNGKDILFKKHGDDPIRVPFALDMCQGTELIRKTSFFRGDVSMKMAFHIQ